MPVSNPDPETPRQAAEAAVARWKSRRQLWAGRQDAGDLLRSGDALAVLVPQLVEHARQADEEASLRTDEVATLLDQCDEMTQALTSARERAEKAEFYRSDLTALESEKAQLLADKSQVLDQLATGEEWKRKAMGYAQELITLRPELEALGERCHQAEELLSYIVDRHDAAHESAINDPLAGELVEVIIQKDWRDDAAAWFRGATARAALGDTPPNPDANVPPEGDTTRVATNDLDSNAVEPPQPSLERNLDSETANPSSVVGEGQDVNP